MAVDQWNGNGNWQSNSSDWSTGAPPASNATAEIETGSSTLTGSGGSVQSIVVDANTSFYTYETTLATVLGANNAGNLAIDNSGGGPLILGKDQSFTKHSTKHHQSHGCSIFWIAVSERLRASRCRSTGG